MPWWAKEGYDSALSNLDTLAKTASGVHILESGPSVDNIIIL